MFYQLTGDYKKMAPWSHWHCHAKCVPASADCSCKRGLQYQKVTDRKYHGRKRAEVGQVGLLLWLLLVYICVSRNSVQSICLVSSLGDHTLRSHHAVFISRFFSSGKVLLRFPFSVLGYGPCLQSLHPRPRSPGCIRGWDSRFFAHLVPL